MKGKEKENGDRDRGNDGRKGRQKTKSAKTRSGQFWTITIVFIAPETVLTFLRRQREKHTRTLSTGLFLFVESTGSLDLLGCIFWRFFAAYFSSKWWPASLHSTPISLRFSRFFTKRFYKVRAKKVFLSLETEVSLFSNRICKTYVVLILKMKQTLRAFFF